jgi:hypothetical protein
MIRPVANVQLRLALAGNRARVPDGFVGLLENRASFIEKRTPGFG